MYVYNMYVWVRREIYTTHTHTYIYHAVDFIVFVSQILQYVKIFDVFFFLLLGYL